MIDREKFSNCLIILRKQRGISGVEMADAMGIKKQSYYAWESGKAIPTADALVSLADYFNVSIDYLVGRDDVPNRKD